MTTSFTTCDEWLNTVSDTDLDNYSQVGLANEAWKRGAAHAAREVLNYLESVDTIRVAVSGLKEDAKAIGKARITADKFIGALTG